MCNFARCIRTHRMYLTERQQLKYSELDEHLTWIQLDQNKSSALQLHVVNPIDCINKSYGYVKCCYI